MHTLGVRCQGRVKWRCAAAEWKRIRRRELTHTGSLGRANAKAAAALTVLFSCVNRGAAEKQAMLLCILFTVTGFGMWAKIFKEEIEK